MVSPRYSYSIAIDSNDPTLMYSGEARDPVLFKSTDAGNKWRAKLDLRGNPDLSGVRWVEVDSSNPNNVYAGIVGKRGTIYSSSDYGESWDVFDDDLTFSTIHAMAIDPNNENIVYAAPWGGGLFYIAEDDWEEIKTPTISIAAIIVDPEDSQHIFIADRTAPKIYESYNKGQSWRVLVALDEGKYYRISTMALHKGELYFSAFNKVTGMISLFLDGPMSGTTFKLSGAGVEEVSDGIEGNIMIDFFSDSNNLYAVSHIYGVHRLEGTTWKDISPDVDMGFNNIIADDIGNLYVSGASDIDFDLKFRLGGNTNIMNNIYKSADGGDTWAPLLQSNPFSSPIKKILQHPTQKNMFYAATGTGIYKSDNRGDDWVALNDGLDFRNIGAMVLGENRVYAGTLGGGVYIGDPSGFSASTGPYPEIYNIQIKVDPANSNTIYATSYPGGVFKSTDGGNTWIESNFALPSFKVDDPFLQGYYSLEIDPTNTDILYLGIFGKGVYKSESGAQFWIPMYGDMGQNRDIMQKGIKQIKIDPTNPDNIYLATDEGVYFSDNGAESWEEVDDGLDFSDIISISINSDGSMIYAGTRGAGVWIARTSDMYWQPAADIDSEPRVCWIKIDPTNSDIIYVAFNPTGMYKSTDGGQTWKEINLGLTNTVVYPIQVSPLDSQEIYIGTGYGRDMNSKSGGGKGVYRSFDGGEHWEPANGGLRKDIIVNDIIFDPKDPHTMYIGTEGWQTGPEGIFMSKDKGDSWIPINNNGINEFNVYKMDFDLSGDILYVATAQSSVWKGVRTGVTPPKPACNNNGKCDEGETVDNCPSDCKMPCRCPLPPIPSEFTVCGVDGKTYTTDCDAKCNNVEVACKGECPCKPACVCPAILSQVCGADGKTYSNSCEATCAGVKVQCNRACPCSFFRRLFSRVR